MINTYILGARDIKKSIKNWRLIHIIGVQDILSRYKRSSLGAFWITINNAVMIGALGIIFGNLFNQPLQDFLPYLAVGLILWNFITSVLIEGCDAFVNSENIIKQINLPFFTYLAKIIWKNIIIFLHNIIIIPIIFVICSQSISWYTICSLIGFILLVLNISWMVIILSLVSSRYRDFTQIIQNLLQVSFYATPIVWKISQITDAKKIYFLNFNIFNYFISIIRDPLLGIHVDINMWIINILIVTLGWFVSIYLLGLNKHKIPYWI